MAFPIRCLFAKPPLHFSQNGTAAQHSKEGKERQEEELERDSRSTVAIVLSAGTVIDLNLVSPRPVETRPILEISGILDPSAGTNHTSVTLDSLHGFPANGCLGYLSIFRMQMGHKMLFLVAVHQAHAEIVEGISAS